MVHFGTYWPEVVPFFGAFGSANRTGATPERGSGRRWRFAELLCEFRSLEEEGVGKREAPSS